MSGLNNAEPTGALAAACGRRLATASPIAIDGDEALAAALSAEGRVCTPWEQVAPGSCEAAVLVGGSGRELEELATRVAPGGLILWALVTEAGALHLGSLLGTGDGSQVIVSPGEAALRLERLGVSVSGTDPVESAIPEDLQPLLTAVRQMGGDIDALAVSHHLLWGQLPRRRDAPASSRAIETAVEGALAAGVEIGCRSSDASGPEVAPAASPARVSVVIPVHNGASFTEKCLYGVAEHTGDEPDYEVIVVDNGSDDWTMYLLHAMEGDLQVLSNDRNLGFARACNQGAAAGRGEFLLFLNNDTIPRPGWLRAMVAMADSDPTVGIVGARLLYPDGTVQHAGLELVGGLPDHRLRGIAGDDSRVMDALDLDMVTGACLLIRRHLFEELAGFDTQFVNGVEDVDLCLRAREAGYRVVYCPEAVVEHHEGRTQGRYDHVQENVQRFVARWQGRFGDDGRLRTEPVPTAPMASNGDSVWVGGSSPAPAAPPTVATPAAVERVNWEGSFLLHSSLAHVNRELVLALLQSGRCELGLIPFEPDQFGPEEDHRFEALATRLGKPLTDAQVHVRHRWPPDFSPPPSGRYALMQPWEFGSIPRQWLAAIESGVVEHVWAYSRYVRDCYVDSGVDADRVAIVPAGVDPERFRPGLDGLQAVSTNRGFRFLFVGGTLYRKGIDILLSAYRDAFDADEDVSLVIKDMGVGTFYRNQTAGEQIRALQADPGCADIQYLDGDLPGRQMPHLYAAADALVHPYRGEGFGLPVAEAMPCGLPVIVTRGGACDDFCPEDIVYGVQSRRQPVRLAGQETVAQAWQLEPDVEALKERMRDLFENRDEGRQRGLRGSEHVRRHVTWQASASAALEAIERLRQAPPVTGRAVAASASPSSPAAVVVLDREGRQTSLDSGPDVLAEALGPYHRYQLDTASGHRLGEQVEAVRANAMEAGADRLLVLAADVDSAASADDFRRLSAHLDRVDDLGLVAPASAAAQGREDLVDCEYPEPLCLLFRMAALSEVGGFDAAFTSTAVFANAARALRRGGQRVVTVGDVRVEEPEGEPSPTRLLSFGGGALTDEAAAVEQMEQGDRFRRSGDPLQAVECYRRAADGMPGFVEAILVLADARLEAHDAAGALEAVRKLVDLDADSAFAHNYAGLVSARAGDAEAARTYLQRAIEVDPQLVEARVNLGVLEWENRNLEAALEQFREASRLDPFDRELVCNLGLIYAQIDDDPAAAELFRGYLERHPEDIEILERLADVLIRQNDPEAVRAVARQILTQAPDHARARNLLEGDRDSGGEDEAAQG